MAEALPDSPDALEQQIRIFNNLGAVCSRAFDFPNAKKYILKASELAQRVEPMRWDLMVGIYCNMGVLERQEDNLDNARMNFQLAKTHLAKIEDPHVRRQRSQEVLFNLAQLYLRMGMLEDAFNEIRELNENPPETERERELNQARQHVCTGKLVAELANDPTHAGKGDGQQFTEQSLEQFESALKIYERLDDRYNTWNCSVSMLRLKLDSGIVEPDQEALLVSAETFVHENPTEGMLAFMRELRIQFHVVRNEHAIARELAMDLLNDPPELAAMNLVQVFGKVREHAQKMEDERLVELLDHAIRQVANQESGGFDQSLN